MLHVACPACKNVFGLGEDSAGEKVLCPRCGQKMLVPPPQRSKPAPSPKGTGAALTCSCPHCGRPDIPFETHEAHTVFECAKCGGKFSPMGGAVTELAEEPTPSREPLPLYAPPQTGMPPL